MQENYEKKQILEEDFVKGIKNDTKKKIDEDQNAHKKRNWMTSNAINDVDAG